MERAVAIKKLGKLLGKGFGYRINPKAPTPDEREAAKAALPVATTKANELKKKKEERFRAILAADTEYQNLHAATVEASKEANRLLSLTNARKITVGVTVGSMFFSVKAEGDSWEEIFDKLQAEKVRA